MHTHVEARESGGASNSKMSSILALKRKLQHELQAHLCMQHQLLSQLNQVVLPAVDRLQTADSAEGDAPGPGYRASGDANGVGDGRGLASASAMDANVKAELAAYGGGGGGRDAASTALSAAQLEAAEEGDDSDDDDDDDEGEEAASPSEPGKRQRVA